MNKVLAASALTLSMLLIPVASIAAYHSDDDDYYGRRAPVYQEDDSTYVCYRSRMTVRDRDGNERAKYRGCFISESPCARIGRNHFGKYASEGQAENALDRCISGRPRFID